MGGVLVVLPFIQRRGVVPASPGIVRYLRWIHNFVAIKTQDQE